MGHRRQLRVDPADPARGRRHTVVLLDLPAASCLWGIAQRRWRHRGGQHPQEGVFDRVTIDFVRYVVGYRRRMRPRVLRTVAEHAPHAELVVLRSRRAVDRWADRVRPRC